MDRIIDPMLAFIAAVSISSAANPSLSIGEYLEPFAADKMLSGSILVARGKDILFEKSYGKASYELGVPNKRETAFNIASITKTITLIPVLQDLYPKKLSSKAHLSEFVPDFPSGDKITVLDLINHRSGIPHTVTNDADESEHQNAESMTKLAAKAPLLFEPGSKFEYSSAGFSVLARVLEIAEGKSYDEIIRKRVFEVAGMDHTYSCVSSYFIPNSAPSYIQTLTGVWTTQPKDYSFLVGAGCISSTPRDLLALLRAVVGGKFGEMVRKNLADRDQMYWNGLTGGYRAFVQYDRKDQLTIIFCGNTVTGAAELLREAIPKIVRGEKVEEPKRLSVPLAHLEASEVQPYIGTYKVGTESFALSFRDGLLLAGDNVLVPIGNGRFFGVRDFGEVRTVWTADHRVQKLEWYEGDKLVVTLDKVSSPS